jgi:hypothetical protein
MAIVLGLLSAIGPFAIDMYLPALPSIGKDLHTAGIFFDGTPFPMIVGIAICAVITFIIAQVTLSRGAVTWRQRLPSRIKENRYFGYYEYGDGDCSEAEVYRLKSLS